MTRCNNQLDDDDATTSWTMTMQQSIGRWRCNQLDNDDATINWTMTMQQFIGRWRMYDKAKTITICNNHCKLTFDDVGFVSTLICKKCFWCLRKSLLLCLYETECLSFAWCQDHEQQCKSQLLLKHALDNQLFTDTFLERASCLLWRRWMGDSC